MSTLAVGDVNGDGRPDVAANITSPEYVNGKHAYLLINAGGADLGTPLDLAGAGAITTIADLDRDGVADIVADQGEVLFARGRTGVFARQLSHPSGITPKSVRAADLDGDGKLDLVYNAAEGAATLIGQGDGTFGPPSAFADMTAPGMPGLGDVDGDGKVDVVLPFGGPSGAVGVALNDGTGRFGGYVSYPSGPYATAALVADFNGDGRSDIAAAVAGGISVLLNDGRALFPSHVEYVTADTPLGLLVGDLDNDGALDLVVVAQEATHVFRNVGDGTFYPAETYAPGGQAVALIDLTGDGRPEIVVAAKGDLAVYLNNGDGTLAPGSTVVGADLSLNVLALATADLNNDGYSDVASLYQGYGTVFFSDGTGGLTRGVTYALPSGSDVVLRDLDRDGQPDMIVAGANGVYVFPHLPVPP